MNEATALQVKDDPQTQALQRIKTQKTPAEVIKWRKGRGGKEFPYANTAYVIRELNEAFAWQWDFECDNEEVITRNGQPFEIKVRGKLTVRAGDRVITKMQYGCQPIEGGDKAPSIGDCYKGAASDALKKCASMLGICLDLYDHDSAPQNGKAPTQSQSETDAEKRVRLAKEKAGLAKTEIVDVERESRVERQARRPIDNPNAAIGGVYDQIGSYLRTARKEDSSGSRRFVYDLLEKGDFVKVAEYLDRPTDLIANTFGHLVKKGNEVISNTGPSKDLMRNPKYSPETGAKLGKACQRLVAHGVNGEELLREVNFALTSFGKDPVQSRYELDDESASMIADSFAQWADSLDLKAKAAA